MKTERFKILRKEYKLHFEISLISSLLICIFLFLFFPEISPPLKPPPVYQSVLITINDITQNTVQSEVSNPKPREPKVVISNLIDDPVILPDENIKTTGENKNSGKGMNSNNTAYKPGIDAPQLPFIPKQILEVLPDNNGDITGYINLRLKIGTNGKVIEHKVIANTTGSYKYLQSVIVAAYKSRWEPIKIDNSKIDYWVEKTYTFR
ncbi:MAG: hypothetical protein WAM24_02965 [Ignavibacteriaceae bacterium]